MSVSKGSFCGNGLISVAARLYPTLCHPESSVGGGNFKLLGDESKLKCVNVRHSRNAIYASQMLMKLD